MKELREALVAALAQLPCCITCHAPATNRARYRHGCDEHRENESDMPQAVAVRQALAALKRRQEELDQVELERDDLKRSAAVEYRCGACGETATSWVGTELRLALERTQRALDALLDALPSCDACMAAPATNDVWPKESTEVMLPDHLCDDCLKEVEAPYATHTSALQQATRRAANVFSEVYTTPFPKAVECRHANPMGLCVCTLPAGHGGDHVAHVGVPPYNASAEVERWPHAAITERPEEEKKR